MNDFTKDEFVSILDAFQYIYDDPAWRKIHGWNDELKTKIENMLDNYLEACEKYWPSNMIKACPDCKKHHDE